jgi:hypothetical protein
MAVEPTMSVKRMVTGLRSPSISVRAAFIFSRNSGGAVSCSDLSFDPLPGTETPSSMVPQCLQNKASSVFDVPQLAQSRMSGWPQSWQNPASVGFSCEQLAQIRVMEWISTGRGSSKDEFPLL